MAIRERTMMFSAILSIMLGTLLVMAPGATAQEGGSQVVATGQTITWTAEWTLDPELTSSGDGIDLLVLDRGNALISVGGTNFSVAGSELRDIAIEAFAGEGTLQTIDRGDYDNVSYSLDLSTNDSGSQLAIFTLIFEQANSTSIAVLFAAPSEFQGAMESAQAGIDVDGTQLFNGVDAAVMQQQIDAAAGTTSQPANPTPTTTAPQPAPTQAAQTQPSQTTPTESVAPPTQQADTGDGGLLGGLNSGLGDKTPAPSDPAPTVPAQGTSALANSTVIQSNGVEVSWSDDWTVDGEDAEGVQLASTGSVPIFLGVIDVGTVSEGLDAASLAQTLVGDPDLSDTEIVEAIDVDENRKVIVLVQNDAEGSIYLIYDITFRASGSTAILITAFEDQLGAAVDVVSSTVQVDGQPVFADLRQIAPNIFPGPGI